MSQENEGQPEVVEQGQPTEESAPATTESSPEVKEDWWDTKGMPEQAANRIKSIQTEYNKKAEIAKKSEELERKVSEFEQREKEIINEVKLALANEDRYRELQRMHGYRPTTMEQRNQESRQEPSGPPEFKLGAPQTVEDLERSISTNIAARDKYWSDLMEKKIAEASSLAEARISRVAQPVAEERWKNAVDAMKAEYGDSFDKDTEQSVMAKIVHGPYKKLYGELNERQLLHKVFLAEHPEKVFAHMSKAKIGAQGERSKGKTEPVSRKVPPTIPAGNSNDDIIARVAAKYPGLV